MPSMIRRCCSAKRETHRGASPRAARAENTWFSRGLRVSSEGEPVDRQGRFGTFRARSNLAFLHGFFVFRRVLKQTRVRAAPRPGRPRRLAQPKALGQRRGLWLGGNGFRTLFGGIQPLTAYELPLGGAMWKLCGALTRSPQTRFRLGTSIAEFSGLRRKVSSKCVEHR